MLGWKRAQTNPGRSTLSRKETRGSPRASRRRRPVLEPLEGRRVPTVTSAVDADGVLTVSSNAADQIAIATDSGGDVTVDGSDPGTGAFPAASVTGISILGGPGANVIDFRAFDILQFPELESLTIDGGGGNDWILGPQSSSTSFYVMAPDQGILGGPAFAPIPICTFQNIPNLGAGTPADSFVFGDGAGLSGTVEGDGGGTLDLSELDDAQSVALTGSGASGFDGTATALGGGFEQIGSVFGPTGQGSLAGEDVASTWTLDGAPTYSDGQQTLAVSGFQDLLGGDAGNDFEIIGDATGQFTADLFGGAGDDVFRFQGDAQLVGSIDGGPGFDTLSYAEFGSSIDVQLDGSDATGFGGTEAASFSGGGFKGIDEIIGSPADAGPSLLIGEDAPSAWSLGPDSTYSDGSNPLAFQGFGIVEGSPASANTFRVAASPQSWTIIGGASTDLLQVDAGGRAATVTPTAVMVDGMGTISYSGIGNVSIIDQAGPDIVLDQSHTPEPVPLGQDVEVVLTVTNNGPSAANQVVLTDATPAGLAFVSAAPSQGTVVVAGGTLTADLGALAVGGRATVNVTLRAQAAGAWVNSALVADSDPDVHSDVVGDSQTIDVVGTSVDTTGLRIVAVQPRGGGRKRMSIVLTFNQPLDPAGAVVRSHYKIKGPVRGGRIRPRHDRGIRIKRVIYEPASLAVIILPAVRLPPGRTFLLSVSGLLDAHGDLLDGAGDGQPGSPYRVLFHGHLRSPPPRRDSSCAEIGSSAWRRTPG